MRQSKQITVPELQFNVAQLLKEATGATRSFEINAENFQLPNNGVEFVTPLTGYVQFLRTGADILVTGTLESTIQKDCGRCLNPFTAPVKIELEEIFFPTIDILTGNMLPASDDADEANRIDEQHTLNLYEVVRQALLLESDGVLYCKPDCKGLCPHCGCDRNVEPCTCQDEVIDMRWAGLLELQLDD